MKPDTIEVFENGRIGCYQMPDVNMFINNKVKTQHTAEDMRTLFLSVIEAAKREVVYFKDQQDVRLRVMMHSELKAVLDNVTELTQGKQYPVPDGYEVKVEYAGVIDAGKFKNWADAGIGHKVAILVPKEKEYPNCASCGRAFNPDAKEGNRKGITDLCIECIDYEKDVLIASLRHQLIQQGKEQPVKQQEGKKESHKWEALDSKQQSIEEAADKLYPVAHDEYITDCKRHAFIEGAEWVLKHQTVQRYES